ncbi:hypothetical protein [Ekhidna sp.]
MDYTFLREVGMQYICDHAGEWTDHNTHDPGITILEALCYSLTELGYRTNHAIEDILSEDGKSLLGKYQPFFAPEEVLPNAPLSVNDFRRIVIDLPGIKNCWIEKSFRSEQSLFLSEANLGDPSDSKMKYSGDENDRVDLKGMYEVLLEFEEEELNAYEFKNRFEFSDGSKYFVFDAVVIFPHWEELAFSDEVRDAVRILEIEISEIFDKESNKEDELSGSLFKINTIIDGEERVIPFKLNPLALYEREGHQLGTKVMLSGEAIIPFIADQVLPFIEPLLPEYIARINRSRKLANKVFQLLHDHRNLCEDFVGVRSARKQLVGVLANVEVKPHSDVNMVLGKIYDLLDQYLDPPIKRKSVESLKDQGYDLEDILQGPLLYHGFISDADIEAAADRETIYASDLVSLIMGIDEVIGVSGLEFTNLAEHRTIYEEISDFLVLDPKIYKPRLGTEYCQISFLDQYADAEKAQQYFHQFRRERRDDPMTLLRKVMPEGESWELDSYDSVQNDFPNVYHIGDEGISDAQSEKRKAQAKQLKGYLVVFDQLLADYLSQLSHTKDLFSLDPRQSRTYFPKPVYDVPHVSNLLKAFLADQNNVEDPTEAWQYFKKDPENEYIRTINHISENENTFLRRRNEVLDHLLARHGEDFDDLGRMMSLHQINDAHTVIADKLDFLNDYPTLSRDRSTAFNYKKIDVNHYPDVWESKNISGFERRLYAKLGLENYQRRDFHSGKLTNKYVEIYQEEDLDDIDEYRFRIKDEKGSVLLSSTKQFFELEELHRELDTLIHSSFHSYNYRCECAQDGTFYFNVLDPTGDIVGRRIAYFDTHQEVHKEIEHTIEFMRSRFANERLYVLEHLLLRPKIRQTVTSSSLLNRISYFDEERLLYTPNQSGEEDTPLSLERYYRIKKSPKDTQVETGFGTRAKFVDTYEFEIGDRSGEEEGFQWWLKSGTYQNVYELKEKLSLSARYISDKRRYEIHKATKQKYEIRLTDIEGQMIATSSRTTRKEELEDLIEGIVAHFSKIKSLPVFLEDQLLPPLQVTKEQAVEPYSFKVSVVLPLHTGRFCHPAFRSLAETKIIEELPAHILPEIYWVHPEGFERFERAYRGWLLMNAAEKSMDPILQEHYAYDLNRAHRKLLDALQEIHDNHGIGEEGMEIVPKKPLTESDGRNESAKDDVISFHKDFLVSPRPTDYWEIGEMSIGKEFVIGHTCEYYPGIGDMRMGDTFRVTRHDELTKRGIGRMRINKNFDVE